MRPGPAFFPSGCSMTLYIPLPCPHFHLAPGVDQMPPKALAFLSAPIPEGPPGDRMAPTGRCTVSVPELGETGCPGRSWHSAFVWLMPETRHLQVSGPLKAHCQPFPWVANRSPSLALTCGGSHLSAAHGPQHLRTAGVAMFFTQWVPVQTPPLPTSPPPPPPDGHRTPPQALPHNQASSRGGHAWSSEGFPDIAPQYQQAIPVNVLWPFMDLVLSGLPGWYQVVPDEGWTFLEWMESPAHSLPPEGGTWKAGAQLTLEETTLRKALFTVYQHG